ncbi:bifunctional tetrahydrofolate synthase/dihydrofolate synthase [Shewanella sp. OMA3-2]|uniref:bifunctional tetrahydrofolate synthase/dihydrofolate synthase n=1 Tax=Shewanella sp. OMA3-2 TaxID=2908650 RepID=UPI001F26CCD3|nr:bifunctional tetrahydrofolate synthase/dihydrofolate synthase [Shewanella sp. OMA3-2]UJF23508.1 bifunctional tetrahydrofolate synthase/dihydrofolate synthase [Shewanella sp. OMA3-2]
MHTDTITAPNKDANLAEWLHYLLAIHPSEIEMGLARVSIVAERLGVVNLQPAQVITVAGTNGKGTTCAMLESILIQSGKTVGVYSSPHLLLYNERVRINQQDCSDDQFIAAFQAIEHARADISLTFFEYATLAGLYLFKHAQLDVIILEVGLGGRLDATNIIDSTATIITSIDLDHQEYLGDTRELVGREKAGVCRSGCFSIIGEPNLPQSVIDYAQQINCQLIRVGHEFDYQLNNANWTFSTHIKQSPAFKLPSLPLANAACVVALIDKLWPEIDYSTINKGLELASLPGRLECVNQTPLVLVDVAHNPHAAKYLATQLRKRVTVSGKVVAICGMLKDKDIAGVLAELVDVVSHWNMVTLSTDRGASSAQLIALMEPIAQEQLNHHTAIELNAFNDMNEAWAAVNATLEPNDVVIVFGSFYTVAAFKLLM